MTVHKIQPDLFQHHASSTGFGKHPAVFLRFLYGETSVRTATDLRCESPVSGREPIRGRRCRDLGLRPSVLSFQFHRESLRLFRKHEGDFRRRGFFPQFKHLLCCSLYTDPDLYLVAGKDHVFIDRGTTVFPGQDHCSLCCRHVSVCGHLPSGEIRTVQETLMRKRKGFQRGPSFISMIFIFRLC